MASKSNDDFLKKMRERYEAADSATADKFQLARDDIEFAFCPGKQWDLSSKQQRAGRPLYEFNKTRPIVKAITNDIRKNSPAIKVAAAYDSNRQLADIMQGLIRNIEAQSRADTAYDTAGFYAVSGGYGVFRVVTEYSNDDSFEQDIRVKEIRNPFSVKFDPSAKEFDRRDARYVFVEDELTREEFKLRYPKADPVDFSLGNQSRAVFGDWFKEKAVRIAEYWCKKPDKKTIYQLSDGRVLDEDDFIAMQPYLDQPPPIDPQTGQPMGEVLTLKSSREVSYDRIEMSIVSGKEILEGPYEWAGKFFPFCPVWGDTVNVDGDEIFSGIVRQTKDSQRLFNYHVCTAQEIMANSPRAPFLYTPAMIEGFEKEWSGLATDNAPGLPYNPDPNVPGGMPQRSAPPTFPSAMFEGAQFAANLLKSVTGVIDGPVQSRASSGKAILAVSQQQDINTFDYIDNLARAKAYCGEILVDLIPKIYDTDRQIMVLGVDGKESYVQLNQSVQGPDGQWQVINDLSQGKYSVAVTTGPTYATNRMETFDLLMQMAQNPGLSEIVADLIAKNSDMNGADELEARLRRMGIAKGFIEPGEHDQPMPQPPPDPNIEADAMLKQAQAQKAGAEAERAGAEARKAMIEADLMASGLSKPELERLNAETKRLALTQKEQQGQAKQQMEALRLIQSDQQAQERYAHERAMAAQRGTAPGGPQGY